MRSLRNYTCGFCGGRHAADGCPYASPGDVSLPVILMRQGASKYQAYKTIRRELDAGIDPWAARGLKRLGPEVQNVEPAVSSDVPYNHKRIVLEAIARSGGKEARSLGRVVEIARRLGLDSDAHNIAHIIWSLQKSGFVRFTERKGANGASVLEHIALRPLGRQRLTELHRTEKSEVVEAPVIETEPELPQIEVVPEAAPAEPDEIKRDEAEWMNTPLGPKPEPNPVSDEEFPLIKKLVARQSKLSAAARLLDEAGLVEDALAILEKNIYSDFEQEVIDLWYSREP